MVNDHITDPAVLIVPHFLTFSTHHNFGSQGKDDDLDCAADIRERYPIDEVWNLMMDADEEFHRANGVAPMGPWNYWLVPLLKESWEWTMLV